MASLDLKTLTIDGFIGYAGRIEIPLDQDGITAIIGSTGAGKSTILEAVYYLLTGDTLRTKHSVKDLINKTVNAGYEIAITFIVNGVNYCVKEVRERPGSGLYFYVNGELKLGANQADTRKRISAVLPMAAEDLGTLSFLGQNQTQLLIKGTSGVRGKEIMRLFGLNRYEAYCKAADTCAKKIAQQQLEIQTLVDQDVVEIEKLQNTLSAYPAEIPTDNTEIIRLQEQAQMVELKLEKIREVYLDSQKKAERHRTIASRKQLRERLHESVQRLLVERKQYTAVPDSAILRSNFNTRGQEQSVIRQKLQTHQSALENIQSTKNKCPLNQEDCPVGVPEATKNARIQECSEQIGSNTEKLREVEKILEKLRETLSLAEKRDKIEQELRVSESRIADIGDECNEIVGTDELQQLIEKCQESIRIGEDKFRSLQVSLGAAQISLEHAKRDARAVEDIRRLVTERAKRVEKYNEALVKLSDEYRYTAGALQLFKKASIYKVDLVLDLLNENLSILEYISDGRYKAEFITQRKDSSGKRLLDEVDIVFTDGNKQLPAGMISGGEEAQLQLAVLLAVFETARQVTGKSINTLWLDEVFGPISADTIDRVFEALAALVQRLGITSVKVISHRELDARLFDHMWLAESVNGASTLTTLK